MSTLSMKKWLVTATIALTLTLIVAPYSPGVMFDDVRFAVIVHEMGH